jgi:hypothetical protein
MFSPAATLQTPSGMQTLVIKPAVQFGRGTRIMLAGGAISSLIRPNHIVWAALSDSKHVWLLLGLTTHAGSAGAG